MVKKDRGLADPKQFFFKNHHPKFCLNDSYTLLKVNNLLSLAQLVLLLHCYNPFPFPSIRNTNQIK